MAELTKEESAQLKNAETIVAELKRKAAGGEASTAGGGATGDLTQRQKDAEEFDELSATGGLTELFSSDRAKFDRLREAKQSLGTADLLYKNKAVQIP